MVLRSNFANIDARLTININVGALSDAERREPWTIPAIHALAHIRDAPHINLEFSVPWAEGEGH